MAGGRALLVALLGLAAAAASAAAPSAGSLRARLQGLGARPDAGAASLLEVGGDNPTRGAVVMCSRTLEGEAEGIARALDIAHWRNARREVQADYVSCFTGGRQAHRDTFLAVAPDQERSIDWGVTLHVEKTWTSNLVFATSNRDEPVVVHLRGETRFATVEPRLPAAFVVEPRSNRMLANATRWVGANDASFVFSWKAEPFAYKQAASTVQVSSKEVTVVVEHRPGRSDFYVFNERRDPDPLKVAFDVSALLGTARANLLVRDSAGKLARDTVMAKVEPGKKSLVMTVAAKDVRKPWYYGWTYKWEVGDSPLDVFGLSEA